MEPFSPTQDADHPVKVERQALAFPWVEVEYATVEEAVRRLRGYYRDDPPGWIEETIRGGTPLRTMGAFYRMEATL